MGRHGYLILGRNTGVGQHGGTLATADLPLSLQPVTGSFAFFLRCAPADTDWQAVQGLSDCLSAGGSVRVKRGQ